MLDAPAVIAFACLAATAPLWVMFWWVNRRDRRRWEVREHRS